MTSGARRLAFLSLLYVVEGLPFGFQAQALGVYLRERGVSLTGIGLAGLLAVPWSLKALWAPLVDRHGSERIGRRKSWILPMQVSLALALAIASLVPPDAALAPLLCVVLGANAIAATMDIAVDGLAVEILAARELGLGNAAQVVGYKVGMLLGGGVLMWASAYVPWHWLFLAMAAIVTIAFAVTALVREPKSELAIAPHRSTTDVLRSLRTALRVPGAATLLVVIAGYKMGESLIEPMWSPMLRDHGVPRETIGLYVGTFGMVASILGSLSGGVLATRVALPRALLIASAFRVIALAGQASIAWLEAPSHALVAISTSAEHFFSGVLTTVMFALMMSRTDRTIGATHYTLLATVEVLGKAPLALLSGWVADGLGVQAGFAIGVGLSLAYLGLLAAPAVQLRLAPLRAT
jgi:MFS family permease